MKSRSFDMPIFFGVRGREEGDGVTVESQPRTHAKFTVSRRKGAAIKGVRLNVPEGLFDSSHAGIWAALDPHPLAVR